MEDFTKRLEALEAKVAEGDAKNGILEAQVAKLSSENEGLKKDLAKVATGAPATSVGKVKEPTKPSIPETPFSVGKQKYRFNCAAFVNAQGVTIIATEALADKELLASIVKDYPGVVTKLDS
jgi:hypothetical protein